MVGRRHLRDLYCEDDGRALLELVVALNVILVAIFAFIEFSVAVNQWNSAAKAVQIGARLAALSDPVNSTLTSWTGIISGTNNPGDPISSANGYDRTCTASNASGSSGSCTGSGTYAAAAMQRLISGSDTLCTAAAGTVFGMCDILPAIKANNVSVEYKFTGLGYVGRPGGPVPTIIVRLTGLTFNFGGLATTLGLNSVGIPAFVTTTVGEDLSNTAPL